MFWKSIITFVVCTFFISVSQMNAQDEIPTYTPELLETSTQNIDAQVIAFVLERFEDFSNDNLHALVKIAESLRNVKQASQVMLAHEELERWKKENLQEGEMSSMVTPSLGTKINE